MDVRIEGSGRLGPVKPEEYIPKVLTDYVTTGFGELHSCSPDEYELYCRYFARNYNRHLPSDRAAAILDVGCGPGHFLYYLKKRGYTNYLGIDLSEECLEVCRQNQLRASKADAFEYLAAKAGTFDAIVSNDLFEHLPKDRGFALAELCRKALKEGAPLIVKVPNSACPVVGARARYSDITHEMGFTAHSLRTLLLVSGFTEVEVFSPDIYVTRNPVANLAGKALFALVTAVFRVLYYLYGVRTKELMTKHIIAVATKR